MLPIRPTIIFKLAGRIQTHNHSKACFWKFQSQYHASFNISSKRSPNAATRRLPDQNTRSRGVDANSSAKLRSLLYQDDHLSQSSDKQPHKFPWSLQKSERTKRKQQERMKNHTDLNMNTNSGTAVLLPADETLEKYSTVSADEGTFFLRLSCQVENYCRTNYNCHLLQFTSHKKQSLIKPGL